ncbi:MAG TPA: hypothetical protein VGT02_14340 [Methylomirabilota bacterium]|jgi:heme-degrading monooxygenase HmoA|nr:hypothetical protein [Methylomirabilota bacterium]
MARVFSIHEYDLKPGVEPAIFEAAIRKADSAGLLRLPGLVAHHFVRGLKGARRDAYAAVWVYESREAWERLWGAPESPRPPEAYPENWKRWEAQVLAPFLVDHPDAIRFTSYVELG